MSTNLKSKNPADWQVTIVTFWPFLLTCEGGIKMASTLGRMLSSMRIGGTQALKSPATTQTLQLPKATLPHPTFATTTSPRLLHTTGLRWVKRPDYAQVWLENKLRPKIEPKWDRELYNHLRGPVIKKRPNRNPLGQGIPRAKGVVIKTTVRKPRKPNSGNRKCVLVRLKSGKELTAFIPG